MPRRLSKRKRKASKNRKRRDLIPNLKVGSIHTVVIEDIAANGDGIARIKDVSVFIPGAKIGEIVKIKVKSIKYRKARGELLEKRGFTYDY
ncbi:MAG: deoxyribonuclease [Candidatus Methanomethylicota archaeon]|uniref:Deoxyribonuclease n=1 Tax=Thermoproteota archaeon TaxID=2056631 RepID=A0A497EWE6_9CREN|nr:MAG: deoxyribonuclease [Candidatus Verstraetearchaeota archaeon]